MCLFHVLWCWWLDPKSTSSEGRRLHIQAVPVRSAHRTAGQGGGVPDYAPHEWTASVMGRHVLGCCAMVLLARLESTSSEGRSCHTQSVPARSAHRTAVQVVGSRDLASVCRRAPKPQWLVLRFYPCTPLECVRAFLDPRASSECSGWAQVPGSMVGMCVLGLSNLFHGTSTLTTLVDLHA